MIKSMWVNLERIKPLGSANDPVLVRFGKNTTMDLKTRLDWLGQFDREPCTNPVQ